MLHSWVIIILCAFAGVLKATREQKETIIEALEHLNEIIGKESSTKNYVRFVEPLEPKEVEFGEELELRCEAVGVPQPIVYWTHNGKLAGGIKTDSTIYEKLQNLGKDTIEEAATVAKLIIPCANKKQRGVYKCVARAGQQEIEQEVRVNVVGLPKKTCSTDAQASAPRITIYNDFRFENDLNAAQLICRATPGSAIAWYDGEKQVIRMDNPKYEVLPNGDLLIRKVDGSMMGAFTCVASNDFGEDRASTFFYPTVSEIDEQI